MYSTEGWEVRKEELETLLASFEKTAADACTTAEMWFQRRGEIAMLRYILGLQEADEAAHENFDDLQFIDEVDEDPGNPLED
jgi:hypothetical protein